MKSQTVAHHISVDYLDSLFESSKCESERSLKESFVQFDLACAGRREVYGNLFCVFEQKSHVVGFDISSMARLNH